MKSHTAHSPAPRRRQVVDGEVQVDREHAHPDGAERHQPDFYLPARQPLAQQRADADADREQHQQQRRDVRVAMQHVLGERRELRQEGRAEEPHPRDAQQRTEHDDVLVCEPQVAQRLGERVPVDPERAVVRRRGRNRLRRESAQDGDREAGACRQLQAHARHDDEQAAGELAQQDGDEGAHLDHAVAAGDLVVVQVLRQVGVLDRPEQRRMDAHQEQAGQQHDDLLADEPPGGEQHDADLEGLDDAHHRRLVVLVGELAAGGRQEDEWQDEHGADDEAGLLRRQPGDAQLVGDQDGEGELQDVVVRGAEELRPEEGGEAAPAEERELAGMGLLAHGAQGLRGFVALREL